MVIRLRGRRSGTIPGYVYRQSAFRFNPQPFATENELLKEKVYDSEVQSQGLEQFSSDPNLPLIYCVTGSPDDSKALYFAAYLTELHTKANKFARVSWCSLYGGFKNELLDSEATLSMLVISNLTVNSSAVKLEKARDLLVHYSNIPRVVVAAGEDPISFMTTKLHMPVNAMAYFSANLLRTRVEVV